MKKKSIRNFGFKGWILIFYCFLALFCNCITSVDINVLVPSVAEVGGLDSNVCLSMVTVAGFVSVLIMPVIGKVRKKIGDRLTSGALLIIAGLTFSFLLLNSTNYVMFAVSMSILVSATQSAFYLCTGPLQARWFPQKRGVVVGITTTGANVETAVGVALETILISALGIKFGLGVFGLFTVLVGIIGIAVLRDEPLDAGVYPDNVSREEYERDYLNVIKGPTVEYKSDWTLKRMLTTKEFWLAIFVPAMMGLSLVGIISQFVARNISLGLTLEQAVGAMTFAGIFGMIGSYLFGVIDTKFSTKTGCIFYALFFAAAVLMNLLGGVHVAFVYISIMMVGMSLGGTTNFQISWPASIFGPLDYPTVNIYLYPIMYCIISLNFVLNGIIGMITGSLTIAYIIYVCLLLLAAAAAYFTDSTKWNKNLHPELVNKEN